MRQLMLLGMLGWLTLTSCTTTRMLSHKSEPEQKRDAVECQRDAMQGAGDGYGMVHRIEVNRLKQMCLEGRGWVAQR
jgi:hypothetical protein